MQPIFWEIPRMLETTRLHLHCPQAGDGQSLNQAVAESVDELALWFNWVNSIPTVAESELFARTAEVYYLQRIEFNWLAFLKGSARMIGAAGIHDIVWPVPRCRLTFWVRTTCIGQDYAAEIAGGLVDFSFNVLGVQRVAIHCDTRDTARADVARQLEFVLEGTLRRNKRYADGELCDQHIFGKLAPSECPASLRASWPDTAN